MRKLSTLDATFIGLAAMLGAGVFVVFGPAFELAGSWLMPAILLAGLIAYLNAASISQLAAKVERSGELMRMDATTWEMAGAHWLD